MGTSMMKAITYSEFGMSTDVLKLKELPIPKAGNGEVQVSLQFSGSNPVSYTHLTLPTIDRV